MGADVVDDGARQCPSFVVELNRFTGCKSSIHFYKTEAQAIRHEPFGFIRTGDAVNPVAGAADMVAPLATCQE